MNKFQIKNKLKNWPGFLVKASIVGTVLFLNINAFAYSDSSTIYEARVVDTQPIYQSVRVNRPRQKCWQEAVSTPAVLRNHRTRTPEILGAIVGAAVGNEFGKGRGKSLTTVAGAILGGAIASDAKYRHYSNEYSRNVTYVQRCKNINRYHSEERLNGYRVTYEYNGGLYNTITRYDPGSTIKLNVNISPLE